MVVKWVCVYFKRNQASKVNYGGITIDWATAASTQLFTQLGHKEVLRWGQEVLAGCYVKVFVITKQWARQDSLFIVRKWKISLIVGPGSTYLCLICLMDCSPDTMSERHTLLPVLLIKGDQFLLNCQQVNLLHMFAVTSNYSMATYISVLTRSMSEVKVVTYCYQLVFPVCNYFSFLLHHLCVANCYCQLVP